MDTVIVASSQFYSHYPKRIPKGTVNAEAVLIRLDSEWEGLTVRTHWLNVASGVEKVVLLERDQPNTIPWEVLTDLGELRMGLDGMDGGTIVKPTVWLTYGYVVDSVDPEAGDDPHPPTPSWEQQMVEQARVAAEAAEEAKDAAVNAEKAASQSGPYADEAKKSAEAAKKAQDAAATSAQEAGNAKDQANTAATTAQDHADAAGTSKVAAERASETAWNAQSEASKSAKEAEDAKLEAQKAAAILPAPTQEDAGMVPMVNPEGNGYIFGEAGGGDVGGELLLAEYIHQGNQEIHFASFDWETGIGECSEPHGLSGTTQVMIVPNDWTKANLANTFGSIPFEWYTYQGKIYVVVIDKNRVAISKNNISSEPISVDMGSPENSNISFNGFHLEIPIAFDISEFPVKPTSLFITLSGFVLPYRYRYVYTKVNYSNGAIGTPYCSLLFVPSYGIEKPKNGTFCTLAINATMEPIGIVYKGYSQLICRRRDKFGGDVGSEDFIYTWLDFSKNRTEYEYSHFSSVGVESGKTWSNGTVVRVYAKVVKQE